VLEKLLDGVIWSVGLFRKRPKLLVEYTRLDDMSTGGESGTLNVRWRFRVTITNLAGEDAIELAALNSSLQELRDLPEHHVRALDKLVVERQFVQHRRLGAVVSERQAGAGRLPEPPELSHLRMLLSYRSAAGLTFYTDYDRARAERPNQWSMRRPRGAA
jgi:hypothetical protein